MMRFIARTILMLLASAIGLMVASVLLNDFQINVIGFTVAVLFFTGVSILFEPLMLKIAIEYLPALRGGVALVTTFIGLLLTSMFTDGIRIEGLSAWILSPLIVWLAILLAGIFLPMLLFKEILSGRRAANKADSDRKVL